MSTSRFLLAGGILRWLDAPDARPRPLDDEDRSRLAGFGERYRQALRETDSWDALLALGRDLYAWLDGGERWLDQAARQVAGTPWQVELQVPAAPDELETLFLDAPWETLTNGRRPLAADPERLLSPVRRIGPPGERAEPAAGRLGVVFMAAQPEGSSELQFEAEETAILDATESLGLDLVVEESGHLPWLGEVLAFERARGVQVLHLSCHGLDGPLPVLVTESPTGARLDAAVDDLDAALRPQRPPLVFLSACLSAAPDRAIGSLASSLVRRGVPALLGWAGSVRDGEAIEFAEALYRHIALGASVADAVAWARRGLLDPGRPSRSNDWHQARLVVGSRGGGALVIPGVGGRPRSRRSRAEKAVLAARGRDVPVARAEEFVGRRRVLQRTLSALRRDGKLGVVLHGMGRQGKSSLALRVIQRLRGLRPVVLYRRFSSFELLQALSDTLGVAAARDVTAQWRAEEPDADRLADELVRLLDAHAIDEPILWVLDDFEDLLEPEDPAPKRLVDGAAGPVVALLRALERTASRSAILITSRFTFRLPSGGRALEGELMELPLPPMADYERRKQLRAKLQADGASLAGGHRLDRLLSIGRGNPGLQNTLTLLALESTEQLDAALHAMESFLAGHGEVSEDDAPEIAAFLEDLALRELLGLLSVADRSALRASLVFDVPVPRPTMEALVAEVGASIESLERLVGLGLWEVIGRGPESLAASDLIRGHGELSPLSNDERTALARSVLPRLFETWGGIDGGPNRLYDQDVQLLRLALDAEDASVIAAVAKDAATGLEAAGRYREGAAWTADAIERLLAEDENVPLGLLRLGAELSSTVGDTSRARSYYEQAMTAVERGGSTMDLLDRAAVTISYAHLLVQDGAYDKALSFFETIGEELKAAGHDREHAVTLGGIARIQSDRGEVSEALTLYEEMLAVFESLGDARSRAVTLGDIARIQVSRGEVSEALALHEERLAVFESLGDARSRAVTLGDIARIQVSRGDVSEALTLHEEELAVYESLGDARSRAVALGDIAGIQVSRGEVSEALTLHEERLAVFESLGDARERAVTLGNIARIRFNRGDVSEALKLHEDRLKVFEGLDDQEGKANALWQIAAIETRAGQQESALEHLVESYRICVHLGHVMASCMVGLDLGQLFAAGGDIDNARPILERSRDGFRHLGQTQLAEQVEAILDQLLTEDSEDADE